MSLASRTARGRVARRRLVRQARRRVFSWQGALIAALAVSVMLALHFAEFEWRDVPGMLERVNRPLAFLIMATLPIVGFPISAVYLAVGAIFGPWWGGLVVTTITIIHVGATQLLARTVLRGPVTRWRQAWMRHLPTISEGDNVSMVTMIILVPGLPYLARNCLLALSDVPLRYIFGVGVPLYIVRSYTTLFLGNAGNDPSVTTLAIIGGIFLVKLSISALLFKRLHAHATTARVTRMRSPGGSRPPHGSRRKESKAPFAHPDSGMPPLDSGAKFEGN